MSRISFIGIGRIGQTIAYAVLTSGFADEVVLYDRDAEKTDKFKQELLHALATLEVKTKIITTSSLGAVDNSDVVVISAGIPRKPGDDRRDLFKRNASLMKEFAESLPKTNPNAKYVMVSNPVDMMASVFMKFSGKFIISSGTQVETMRMRSFIAEKLGIPVTKVDGFVAGEHGDAAAFLWDTVTIDGIEFDKMANDKLSRTEVEKYVKEVAAQIIAVIGSTTWGQAKVIKDIVKAIITNENRVMSVAVPVKYDDETIHIGIPTVIGNEIGPSIEHSLSEEDVAKLENAKKEVYAAYKQLLDDFLASTK
jgi:malate dehydrogenase